MLCKFILVSNVMVRNLMWLVVEHSEANSAIIMVSKLTLHSCGRVGYYERCSERFDCRECQ